MIEQRFGKHIVFRRPAVVFDIPAKGDELIALVKTKLDKMQDLLIEVSVNPSAAVDGLYIAGDGAEGPGQRSSHDSRDFT